MKSNSAEIIDKFDRRILSVMAREGRITLAKLAAKVGLSVSPCQARLRRLESNHYITGYHAAIDYARLGQAHIAFVQISLSDTRAMALESFNQKVLEIEAVESCYLIAGGFDYLLKVRSRDINDYRVVLAEQISALPFVASSSTFVSMQSVKN